ncbi:ATP-dependent DNA helicase PIF1 [Lecanosticta acicola]|uniref:ATP-dependent DNA helicase n=1 Tax=Lecanosticta acicola TaxID=111012 RepID=A0AAI8Z7H7_9PEZI|nr:ATP-dependent DNA helicase PIF1 [Lecanosticta acicola]
MAPGDRNRTPFRSTNKRFRDNLDDTTPERTTPHHRLPGNGNGPDRPAKRSRLERDGSVFRSSPSPASSQRSRDSLDSPRQYLIPSLPSTPRPNNSQPPVRQYLTPTPSPSSAQASAPTSHPTRSNAGVVSTNVVLSAEQQIIAGHILSGENVFFTGAAGSGKSTLIKAVVTKLRAQGKRVRLMAPTGSASLSIGGLTIFSFAGWRPVDMKKSIAELQNHVRWAGMARTRMRETDVIIIDEVSMVENNLFERLDRVMQTARQDHRAFGGVQVVVSGDFHQLPPVLPFKTCFECGTQTISRRAGTEFHCPRCRRICYDSEKWSFLSDAWRDSRFTNFQLEEIYRQDDEFLKRVLGKMRAGRPLTAEEISTLWNHECDVENAVRLYSTNAQVDEVNRIELRKLRSREMVYDCVDNFKHNRAHTHLRHKDELSEDGTLVALKNHKYEAKLRLKEGMPVILLVNLDPDKGLVNGSQGEIVRFVPYEEARRATTRGARDSTESVNDWSERNAVAGLRTFGGGWDKLEAEQVKKSMAKKEDNNNNSNSNSNNGDRVWPVVRFTNGQELAIVANCLIDALGDDEPYSLLSRTQIPLTAAWGITIHRSQGMTLEKYTADLSATFQKGQEYVALSRARSLRGLKLLGTPRDLGGSDEGVKEFYRTTEWCRTVG